MTSQNEASSHDLISPEPERDSAVEAHKLAQPDDSASEKQPSTGSNSESSANSSTMKFRLRKTLKSTSGGNVRGEADAESNHWRRLRMTLKAAEAIQRHKKSTLQREDSFLKKFSTRNQRIDESHQHDSQGDEQPPMWSYPKAWRLRRQLVIQHDGSFMFYWLGVVTLAVLYNMWTCIAREAFREIQSRCNPCWFTLDALSDVIYMLDIVVQFRTGYLDQGLMVYETKKLARRYMRSRYLYVDLACLLPLDFIQFKIGIHPMIRFPRFLKLYRTFRFLHMLESRNPYPNLIRVGNLTHILFLGAHWFAAFYFLISEAEGFKGGWSYPNPEGEYASLTRKYLASLFWSTLTLTTIGDLPPPEGDWEYVFVIVSYLIGVFIFATIVGQVGNVITNRNASRQEFERLLDGAKIYMQTHNVPPDLQKRVQRWYDYVWSRGRLNGADINSLGLLPDKLKTELAIHVNLETLRKVTIFQECQPEFLHDLVLKMRAYIFTPGDLICRRGEVAREMFIIADGVVEIISESGTVLKQMGAGDFFGEIGILNLDGGINRRSADVRSVGFSELFVLSREDVLGALKDHPDAESIIRDYGQRRLREIEAHRQRVKPLARQEAVNQLPTVHNSLLFSLRSVPSARRRPGQPDPAPPQSPRCAPSTGRRPRLNTSPSLASEDSGPAREPRGGSLRRRRSQGSILDSVFGSLRKAFRRRTLSQKTTEETPLGSDITKAAWGEDGGAAQGGRVKGAAWGNPRMAQNEPPPPTAEGDSAGSGGGGTLPSLWSKVIPNRLSSRPPGYQAVSTEDADNPSPKGGSESTTEGQEPSNGETSKVEGLLVKGTLKSPLRANLNAQDSSDNPCLSHVVETTAGIESKPSTSVEAKKLREDVSNCSAPLVHNPTFTRKGSNKFDVRGVGSTADQDGEGARTKGMGLLLRSLVRGSRDTGVAGGRRSSSSNSVEESPGADGTGVPPTESKECMATQNSCAVSEGNTKGGGGECSVGSDTISSTFVRDNSERSGVKEVTLSNASGTAQRRTDPQNRSEAVSSSRWLPRSRISCGRGLQPLTLAGSSGNRDRPANSGFSPEDIESSGSEEDMETCDFGIPLTLDLFASAQLNGVGDRRGSLDRWRRAPALPTITEAESPSMRDLRVFMEDKLNRLEELHSQSVRTLTRLADSQEQLLTLLQESLPRHSPLRHQQNTSEPNSARLAPCCEETRL